MTDEQLNQILSQTRLGIERDEAEAKQRMAAANEKRMLLTVIEDMRDQLKQAKAKQQVHNTYHIGHDYIVEQNINKPPVRYEQSD